MKIAQSKGRWPVPPRRPVAHRLLGAATVLIALAGLFTALGGPRLIGVGAGAGTHAAAPVAARAVITIHVGAIPLPTTPTSPPTPAPPPASSPAAPIPAAPIPAGPGTAPTPPINPASPVSVTVAGGVLTQLRLIDTAGGAPVSGAVSSDRRSWRTTAPLAFARTYQIAVTAVGANHQVVTKAATLRTVTPVGLTSLSTVPGATTNSTTNSTADTVGVGQPLVVRFSHPVADKAAAVNALRVTTSPPQPGSWYWMSGSEAHYRGPSYWAPGTTITLAAHLFGVDLGGGRYGATDRDETIHVHDAWIAKADGHSHQMRIFDNGVLVKTMAISLGSPAHPSHNGPHVISDKQPSIIMDSCTYGVCAGDPGYYKEKVNLDERISIDGEFVHSAPWSVRQQGRVNVSHGCVNLSPANAAWFYSHFTIGDVVEITNSGGPTLPLWDNGDWTLPWTQWHTGTTS